MQPEAEPAAEPEPEPSGAWLLSGASPPPPADELDARSEVVAGLATLAEASAHILRLLATRHPRVVPGGSFPPQSDGGAELHQLPPHIPKPTWGALGDKVKQAESEPCPPGSGGRIGGDRWISLRLDGTGFSSLLRRLRTAGVFAVGFAPEFAALMREGALSLIEKFTAVCAYTQSDEMTVLIPPARVVRGQQQPHPYNGRLQKLATLAAGHVTALFNFRLAAIAAAKGLSLEPKLL
eukprot:SAG11_NODE_9775_length_881_cov_1.590793_1_plen_236_part_10